MEADVLKIIHTAAEQCVILPPWHDNRRLRSVMPTGAIHQNESCPDLTDLTTGPDYIQSPNLVKVRYFHHSPGEGTATQGPKSAQFMASTDAAPGHRASGSRYPQG